MSADVEILLNQGLRALLSARLLLENEDAIGACNRAYYAMFQTARAALTAIEAPEREGRTHAGIISGFGLRFVKTGLIDREVGRRFNRVEQLRLSGDYREQPLDLERVVFNRNRRFSPSPSSPANAGGQSGFREWRSYRLFFVHTLASKRNGRLYIGRTDPLRRRLPEHEGRQIGSSKTGLGPGVRRGREGGARKVL